MASGTTTSTAQIRRPGRSVRSTHQAAAVPRTAQRAVTTRVSRIVFQSSSRVRPRKINRVTTDVPAPCASISRKTSGSASSAATAALATIRATGRRARRAAGVLASWGRCRSGPGVASTGGAATTAARRGTAASQQSGFAQDIDGREPVAELADRNRIRLQLS